MKIQFGLAVVLTGVLALGAAGDAVARGGGGGGGGGGAVTEPVILSTSVNPCPFDFGAGNCAPVIGTDQTVQITVGVQSDAGDTPSIVQTSGPPLVPTRILPSGRGADAHGVKFGLQDAVYEWTPTRDDIGLDASASFTATTASGKTVSVTVPIGVVQDLAPGILSGLTVARVGDNFEITWDPPADGRAVTYSLGVCEALDPTRGAPLCLNQPLPGVSTVTDPGGTLTAVTIPTVLPVGFFTPGVAAPAAYLILRASSINTFGSQENVLALPQ